MIEMKKAKNLEELKKAYRQAALKNHPDKGGTDEAMAAINNLYEKLFERLKGGSEEVAKDFVSIIDELMKHEGLEIDIVGTWLWVYGNTYGCKEELKKLGFKWASKKKKWYLGKVISKRRSNMSYEDITGKYGVKKVQEAKNPKALNA